MSSEQDYPPDNPVVEGKEEVQVPAGRQADAQGPQVEILMATHNGERYLSSQIESILAQDYGNILLTIFDDGSTDETIRCIEQYVGASDNGGGGVSGRGGTGRREGGDDEGVDEDEGGVGSGGQETCGGGKRRVTGGGSEGDSGNGERQATGEQVGNGSSAGEQVGGGHRVRLVGSERVGLPAVFFRLLSFIDPQSCYIGYADQDDLWLPGKVSRAVRFLDKVSGTNPNSAAALATGSRTTRFLDKVPEGRPALYCSRVFIADEWLQVGGITPIPKRGASFANALVQGIAPGSTMLFDRKAASLLDSFTPQDSPMHDWWTYLVVSAVGDVVFDGLPSLLYRQHNTNARGVGNNGRWSWRKRILWHFREGAHNSTRQAAELRRWLVGSMPELNPEILPELELAPGALPELELNPEILPELDDFLDSQHTIITRARYCLTGSAHRQRKIDDLVFRMLYLLGRI